MSERLRRGLRQHKGGQLLPQFQRKLEAAIGLRLTGNDFLDLDSTERLRHRFFAIVKSDRHAWRETWQPDQTSIIWTVLERVADSVDGQRFALFHRLNGYLGAVWVPGDAVLRHALEVWQVVGEDLCLAGEGLASGLCLEFNHYADHDEYELTAWGGLVPPSF